MKAISAASVVVVRLEKSIELHWICRTLNTFRINHSKLFADKENHINEIENFWNRLSVICTNLTSFPKSIWAILKECEWRFKNSDPSAKAIKTIG